MTKDILTPKLLAERWGVSTITLRQWRWKGIGPLYFKTGKVVHYRTEDVKDFEKSQLRSSTSMRVGNLELAS